MLQIPLTTYEKGDIIFKEGDSPSGLFVIRAGSVRITRDGITLDTIGKNAFFGEMALVDQQPRSATATAMEYTQCMKISSVDFQQRVGKLDPLMQGIFRVMIDRLRSLNDKLSQQ